jgi:GNAT superfamily N-acetyltransferase
MKSATKAEIREEALGYLDEYGRVPISFRVERVLELSVRESGLAGFELRERPAARPFVKDYDAEPGNLPSDWPRRFDVSGWGLFSARLDGDAVGGAALAFRTPGLMMLEGRSDLAVLWDLRVAPHARRRGIAAALFAAAEDWARARGCRWLKVETQNINVPACRFYASRGCELGGVHRFAYPELPDEIQLLWYKQLPPR